MRDGKWHYVLRKSICNDQGRHLTYRISTSIQTLDEWERETIGQLRNIVMLDSLCLTPNFNARFYRSSYLIAT